jgi:hypothetical protein
MIRISMAVFALALPFALTAGSTMAEDHPLLYPNRDVAVTYQILGDAGQMAEGAHVTGIRVNFTSGGQRMRIEPMGRPAYMLMDRASKRMTVVMPAQHSFMELPFDANRFLHLDDVDAHLTRRGQTTVAGLECTEYDVQTPHGQGTTCLTGDGVMLRAKGTTTEHRGGGLEATEVTYGAQPAGLFVPPADFKQMEMPQLRMPPAGSPTGATKN